MGDDTQDGSGWRPRRSASATKVALRVGRLHERLARLTRQMRRCMTSLCGTTQKEGDKVMQQIFRLRQEMRATRRRIINLEYQDGARN
jgi:hypothetical protein